jgi:hypothetical protein
VNYGQLKTAIAARLGRNNLTAVIPDFITLGEGRMYYGMNDPDTGMRLDPLRLLAMQATETASLASLPTGFIELQRLTVPAGAGTRALAYATPEQFADLIDTAPRFYTFQDGGIAVQGGTPASFKLAYYKKFTALADDADTNWLLTNHPAVYLYSALIEAYAHIKDDARIGTAVRLYSAQLAALIDTDRAMRHSGSTLTIPSAHPC